MYCLTHHVSIKLMEIIFSLIKIINKLKVSCFPFLIWEQNIYRLLIIVPATRDKNTYNEYLILTSLEIP